MTNETKNWLTTQLQREGIDVARVWHLIELAQDQDARQLAIAKDALVVLAKPITGKGRSCRQKAKLALDKMSAVPSAAVGTGT